MTKLSKTFCQMQKSSFGEYIRELRTKSDMPLRKLASELDIDTSTLSKIERKERYAQASMVPILAKVFHLEYKELQIFYWRDKLLHDLCEEDFIIEALEQTIQQLSNDRLE